MALGEANLTTALSVLKRTVSNQHDDMADPWNYRALNHNDQARVEEESVRLFVRVS